MVTRLGLFFHFSPNFYFPKYEFLKVMKGQYFISVVSKIFFIVALHFVAQKAPAKTSFGETEHYIALAVCCSMFEALKVLVEENKYAAIRPFPSRFIPLSVLIWNSDNTPEDVSANRMILIDYQIKKGASVKLKVPPFKAWTKLFKPYDNNEIWAAAEGILNVLQLTMLGGSLHIVRVMQSHEPNTAFTYNKGNTLLHLAAMYDYIAKFNYRFMINTCDLLMLEKNILNSAGKNIEYISRNKPNHLGLP